MSNKVEEQLKLLNEILSIITFDRRSDGSLCVFRVKGDVTIVEGDVSRVEGCVGTVDGHVWNEVRGNVKKVGGDVGHLQGKVKNYVEQDWRATETP